MCKSLQPTSLRTRPNKNSSSDVTLPYGVSKLMKRKIKSLKPVLRRSSETTSPPTRPRPFLVNTFWKNSFYIQRFSDSANQTILVFLAWFSFHTADFSLITCSALEFPGQGGWPSVRSHYTDFPLTHSLLYCSWTSILQA